MKQKYRKAVDQIAGVLEIVISVVILIVIAIMSIQLGFDIFRIIGGVEDGAMRGLFELFLGDALKLIIAIEFVRMIVERSPERLVEMLLFAMARKLIVGSTSTSEVIVGIGAIAVLFVIRRFLFEKEDKIYEDRFIRDDDGKKKLFNK